MLPCPVCYICRPRVTLVCKRWEGLFYAEPALWRHFLLRPANPAFPSNETRPNPWGGWCAAKHRQLARVAGLVEVFEAGPRRTDFGGMRAAAHASCWRLVQYISLLRPEVLTEAVLWWELAELPELLRFPRLTRLLLHDGYNLPPGAAAVLGRLPQLRSLALHAHEVSGGEMAAVLGLSQLTQLLLLVHNPVTAGHNYESLPGSNADAPSLMQLTRLAQLRQLTIKHRPVVYGVEQVEIEFEEWGVVPLPAPSAFAALESYDISFYMGVKASWEEASNLTDAFLPHHSFCRTCNVQHQKHLLGRS